MTDAPKRTDDPDEPWWVTYSSHASRIELPGQTLGELLKPGTLIQEVGSFGPGIVCPLLVDEIVKIQENGREWPGWTLRCFYAPKGECRGRHEDNRAWINQVVAVPLEDGFEIRPVGIYDYNCPARDFAWWPLEQRVQIVDRKGQLGLGI